MRYAVYCAALAALTAGVNWAVAHPPAAGQRPEPTAAGRSPWPKANADAQNTGRGYGRAAAGHVKWVFRNGSGIPSSPIAGPDGMVYACGWDRKTYALDGRTGVKRWEFASMGRIMGSPALSADGAVVYA